MSKWWRAAAGSLKRPAENPKHRSHYHTIQAIPREVKGSRGAARDRAQGRIPAVVFSQTNSGDPTAVFPPPSSVARKRLLTTEKKQIKAILKSVELPFIYSTTFPLQIRAGSGSSTLIESGRVLPIKAENGKDIKVDVPLVFIGEDVCPGIQKDEDLQIDWHHDLKEACTELTALSFSAKAGGYLRMVRRSLRFSCPAEHIPPKIEVDVSKLDIGDKLLMHDIQVHPTLKLLSKNEAMPVCKIMSTKTQESENAR
ncbi:hypothetical protein ACH5RR_014093 [Cinchona calisaya]|uniref:Large ribosomal subunit protein bL25 beta domain-containing protein n=1 Tax=Cinchona calisaya TaxID=153742 RepID=A0ABD3A1X2_9GENT